MSYQGNLRRVLIRREANGDVIAQIPLDDKNEKHVEMDLSSYHALLNLGYSERLTCTKFGTRVYPTYRDPNTTKHILVGRLLAGAKEKEIVKYRDDNPLNLRMSNIRVT